MSRNAGNRLMRADTFRVRQSRSRHRGFRERSCFSRQHRSSTFSMSKSTRAVENELCHTQTHRHTYSTIHVCWRHGITKHQHSYFGPSSFHIPCDSFSTVADQRLFLEYLSMSPQRSASAGRLSTCHSSNALRHGSHSFTCKLHHACLYSPAAEHRRPLASTHFTVPRRVEG